VILCKVLGHSSLHWTRVRQPAAGSGLHPPGDDWNIIPSASVVRSLHHIAHQCVFLGCPAGEYPHFARVAQRRYARLFPGEDAGAAETLARLRREMAGDAALAQACAHQS